MDKHISERWLSPKVEILGKAKDLIRGGNNETDPKSTLQPNDNVFEGISAGTEDNPG
tara:strand:+ start:194 stop:364 length:171 start_codon:yes stop_codon:yes gene_type:complete